MSGKRVGFEKSISGAELAHAYEGPCALVSRRALDIHTHMMNSDLFKELISDAEGRGSGVKVRLVVEEVLE